MMMIQGIFETPYHTVILEMRNRYGQREGTWHWRAKGQGSNGHEVSSLLLQCCPLCSCPVLIDPRNVPPGSCVLDKQ